MKLHHTCLELIPNYSVKISKISFPIHYNSFLSCSPFPSLQRYNTNPVISTTKPTPFTYKDYQTGSANNPHRVVDTHSEPEPLTSIYTFPSLIKPTNNWRKPPSTIDAPSSAWRLFGVNRVLN
jgi:hypothetical protein